MATIREHLKASDPGALSDLQWLAMLLATERLTEGFRSMGIAAHETAVAIKRFGTVGAAAAKRIRASERAAERTRWRRSIV